MRVMMVRARVKPENADSAEAAAKTMFSAIDRARPSGGRYASCKLPDGVTFVAILELDDPSNNPLGQVPEFLAFQNNLKNWLAESPAAEPLSVVGSYRLF